MDYFAYHVWYHNYLKLLLDWCYISLVVGWYKLICGDHDRLRFLFILCTPDPACSRYAVINVIFSPLSAPKEDPEFTDQIENVTVAAGRSVKLACSVKNLGTYKVSLESHCLISASAISTGKECNCENSRGFIPFRGAFSPSVIGIDCCPGSGGSVLRGRVLSAFFLGRKPRKEKRVSRFPRDLFTF